MMLVRMLSIAALSVGLISGQCLAEEQKLSANPEKSKIDFVGTKTDGQHTGGFKKYTADAVMVEDAPTKSSLSIKIDAKSLYSDDEKLTNHLKNPDFFDVTKYPTIEFDSMSVKYDEKQPKSATIVGKLKMLGKEETLEVPVVVEENDTHIVVNATFKLDRTKWGMNYGVGKIDKEVAITASLHFDTK